MRQINRPMIIFALNASNDTLVLEAAGFTSKTYKELDGSYKGQTEKSYIVDAEHLETVMQLARMHNQESILLLDQDRNASLYYIKSGLNTPIGRLVPTSEAVALSKDAWSYRPDLNTFYIVE